MRIAILAPINGRIPPDGDDARGTLISQLAEGLVKRGIELTLFATGDSITSGRLESVVAKGHWEESSLNPTVYDCLHVSNLFEKAADFDLIHNHAGFLALPYSAIVKTPILTTMHGRPSRETLPVYKKYNGKNFYVSTHIMDRVPELDYFANVSPGIDTGKFVPRMEEPNDFLLALQASSKDGVENAIRIGKLSGKKLILASFGEGFPDNKGTMTGDMDGQDVSFVKVSDGEAKERLFAEALALIYTGEEDASSEIHIMEAMTCGTPVIAMETETTSRYVRNGKTGFLFAGIDDAANMVLRLAEVSREECRKYAESHFSHEQMVNEYLDLYRKVLEAKGSCRPWGYFENLSEGEKHKVKRIVVEPGQRLSLQRHQRRSEHWVVIRGQAVITLDGEEIFLSEGESIDIPRKSIHRIMNPGNIPLVFVEVQLGEYFGEDDIERMDDDYGRG